MSGKNTSPIVTALLINRRHHGDAMNLFEQQWPADLPLHCPHCKRPFLTSRNLSIGPGRLSRFFRACAYWSMVPWSILAWVVLALWLNPLSLALFCFVPLILFMPLAIISPNSRRVRCSHGHYDHDFPARPNGCFRGLTEKGTPSSRVSSFRDATLP